MHTADPGEDETTIEDLRLLVSEIKKFLQMGDDHIVLDARRALWRVLHRSAKRLRTTHPPSPHAHPNT